MKRVRATTIVIEAGRACDVEIFEERSGSYVAKYVIQGPRLGQTDMASLEPTPMMADVTSSEIKGSAIDALYAQVRKIAEGYGKILRELPNDN